MEADFAGYVTKASLRCSDGRIIAPNAFMHQDKAQVPLVYMHGHTDVENVLGHMILENRPDGVYGYGFLNETAKAKHAAQLLEHGDIKMMSIWANQLVERSKQVLHGFIREVSLVLSGANPGATIESVSIRHSDGIEEVVEDEGIIHTGLEFDEVHVHGVEEAGDDAQHSETGDENEDQVVEHKDQNTGGDNSDEKSVKDIYESMSDPQKQVVHYMVGEALSASENNTDNNAAEHSNIDKEGDDMGRSNVFEQATGGQTKERHVISHDDMNSIVQNALKGGSLKEAVEAYASEHLEHGINDIDLLFPEAQLVGNTPEFLSRRVEWVAGVLNGVRKSPFSRIKTFSADITMEEARAKGYVKGAMKKEEFITVSRRITTPTTIYKKQKLDRDDIVDITDFDVVAWLKGEMRLMLDEEIARAILIGDGRDISDEDKINEQNLRPIATDHELFTSVVTVNLDDASSTITEVVDSIVKHRALYKGSGLPTMYTTETIIAKFMLLRDTVGRRIYRSLDELAAELRVKEIIPVEVMEETPEIVCVLVNMTDYVVGADKGGNVNMFDDFDIDYNQYKYLIETRISGALVKLKAAIVVKKTTGTNVLVAPNEPTWDPEEGEVTIVNQTGVVYKNGAGTVINAAGSPYSVASGETYVVNATPATGYYFETSDDDSWSYTNEN